MENTYLETKHAPARTVNFGKLPDLRCSIVLPASTTPDGIRQFVERLNRQRLSADYEVVVDVRAARGKFLLLMKQVMSFNLQVLEESIRGLEHSGQRLSVSETGNFTLVERSFYLTSQAEVKRTDACGTVHRVKNLNDDSVEIRTGPDTFIDPEAIVDAPQSIRIGAHCTIRKGVVLRPEGGEIVIGDHCVINHYCILHAKGGIYIGDWSIIAPHCGFYAQNHTFERFDIPITRQANVGHGIYLMGDNWIGGGAIVCDDVTIGKGAVIGANSTVTRSIPMASVAAGSPARVIRKRYKDDWDFHQRERAACEGMPAKFADHVKERGARIARLLESGDRVLDVGCGEGMVTAILASACREIVGCDYSAEAVAIAAQRFPQHQFICSNSTYLRFPDASFTKVVCSDVAEHLLPVQLRGTLREIARVLKPDGMLLLATPLTGKGLHTSTYAHIYEYSAGEMTALLGQWFGQVRLVDEAFGILCASNRSQ